MTRTATPAELVHAEDWLKARGFVVQYEAGATHGPVWFYDRHLPELVLMALDMNYGGGDEPLFKSRAAAVDALAVTLAQCNEAWSVPVTDAPCVVEDLRKC